MDELKKLTMEPHGDGHAVYSGREQGDYDPGDGSFFAGSHGNRLFNVTDATEAGLRVAHEMVAAVNALPELLAQRDAVLKAYDGWMVSRAIGDPDTEHKYAQALSTAIFAMKPARAALNQEPKL